MVELITVSVKKDNNIMANFYFTKFKSFFCLWVKNVERKIIIDVPYATIVGYNNTELNRFCEIILSQKIYQEMME